MPQDRRSHALLAALLVGATFAPGAAAQSNGARAAAGPLAVTRLSGPIELDGRVDEAAWDEIDPLPLIQYAPNWGAAPSEPSEIRLGYDSQNLYLSGRLYDSDPEGIRLNTFYRDQFSGDDLLAIIIDSYNDYETAVWFSTNPAGARSDRTMANDAESSGGGPPMNSDWNSHWDVATSVTEDGWFAEFRIPFSTLGFQAEGDRVTMGVTVYRFIARKNERQLFPAISQEYGGFGFAKPSQSRRVTIDAVQPSNPIYVTPYLLGGIDQRQVLREPPDVANSFWERDDDPTTEVGGDLRYSPTSNLSIDLTVNTDFAQVEADDQQINLTRFPLFFPEKRQFFQERSSTFDFGTGGGRDRLFFSRRIGLDDGDIVRIYGGGRAVGRLGGLDYGVLNMQTAGLDDRSGENVGVVRLKQQAFNPYSYVGGMLTTRLGADGQDNVAYGLDTQIRLFGDEYLTLKWAQTFDEELEEGSAFDAGLVQANWVRRRDEGLSYEAGFRRVGSDYLARLGFQSREDFTFYGGRLSHGWFPDGGSFRSITLSGQTDHYYRNEDDSAESRSFEPSLRFDLRSGGSISLTGNSSFESVREAFDVADLSIPEGDYWFHNGRLRLEASRNALFRGSVTATAGRFYDGSRTGVSVEPSWNPSRHLELSGGYEINRISFDERDERATTHLGRLRVQFALDTHLSFNTFAQYNSLTDQTSINARFRYNFREGTDLWIVYTEGFNLERENGIDPRLPVSAGRTLLVKYSHTLIF